MAVLRVASLAAGLLLLLLAALAVALAAAGAEARRPRYPGPLSGEFIPCCRACHSNASLAAQACPSGDAAQLQQFWKAVSPACHRMVPASKPAKAKAIAICRKCTTGECFKTKAPATAG